jgi:hypothetical protein
MEEVPIVLGLQIIDAECLTKGIVRHRIKEVEDFDSQHIVEEAFKKLRRGNIH